MIRSIKGKEFIFLPCQKVIQPIGALYVGSLPWSVIKKTAYVNPRIFLGYDDEGREIYDGIQRSLSSDRKKEIMKYVTDPDATFPTAILLNIPIEKVLIVPFKKNAKLETAQLDAEVMDKEFINLVDEDCLIETKISWLIFPLREGIVQIIDGQHRMSGFENAPDDLVFDLPVTFFLNQNISEQAEMFAVINGKQTRVTPSLVYELFGISPKRSPYTVASKVVKLLNESNQSPLYRSIKILGKSSSQYTGFITQSTVAKIIIELICGNPKQAEEDKRVIRREEELSEQPTLTNKQAILRRYFIKEKDEVIFKVISNFFNAIKIVFLDEWEKENTVLKKTIGFTALTKIMSEMVKEGMKIGDMSESYFTEKLMPFSKVDFDNIQLSSKGIKQIVDLFKNEVSD